MKKEIQTLSQVIERLDRLEKSIAKLNQQLSLFVDAVVTSKQKNFKTGEEVMAFYGRNKKQNADIVQEVFEKIGISGKPIPAEELQARMAKSGICAEDNEFSRAIIEEREK
ncbi:hypothetical protein C6501_02530 [Candidatus Poribacteria bacterium]|nr:MAG: hypothetical protein C6501_02530 [Candidatus Poribacteria bacterium]